MSELNTTVDNMMREDLVNEYLNLKAQNQTLSKELDERQQQLYEAKRQLQTSNLMIEELSAELESGQNKVSSETIKLMKKITTLEEEILHLKQSSVDTAQQFEQELVEKDREIEELKEKMREMCVLVANDNKNEIIEKQSEEIFELKSKNELLELEQDENKFKIEEMNKYITALENKQSDVSHDLEEMKEFLAIKREELEASNERFHNLQDELIVTQMELDKFKNVPEDQNKKGNSLFAEVEDNRQKLKKYIQTMNKKYADMKASYNRKILELQKLHTINVGLRTEIKEYNHLEDDQTRIMKTYENTIELLKENIETLKKELVLRKQATHNILNDNQKAMEALIEISRKELVELRLEHTNQQFDRISSEKVLYDAHTELRRWRLETQSLRSENLILKQTVEDLKMKTSNSPTEPQDVKQKSPKLTEASMQRGLETNQKILQEKKENIFQSVKKAECDFSSLSLSKNNVPINKYEGINFCKQRTLTVVENDLFNDSTDSINSKSSFSHLNVHSENKIPNLTSSAICYDSFEEFTNEMNLNKPLSGNLMNDLEQDLLKLNLNKASLVLEDDKENVENKTDNDQIGKKVTFSKDTIDNVKKGPIRKGRVLVPKNVMIAANIIKKK